MKTSLMRSFIGLVLFVSVISVFFSNCKKAENPVKFPKGIFPDSTMNLSDINSAYDDFNCSEYTLSGSTSLIFSSNRNSSGGQFDLVQGAIKFTFDQTDGTFGFDAEMTSSSFLTKLLSKANTTGNDFGPLRLFSSIDGYEYLILSSQNSQGNLDFFYLKNRPGSESILPEVLGPYPAQLINTGSDDAYMCFDLNQDTCYFSTNAGGTYDIYLKAKSLEQDISAWLGGEYMPSAKIENLSSSGDDKCPFVHKKLMVFASNRPGGLGGYDLYYSVFRNGNWSTAVNFGPEINTSSDEFRPVIIVNSDFMNYMMIFSSDRPGGKGGFDLYLRGIEIPE